MSVFLSCFRKKKKGDKKNKKNSAPTSPPPAPTPSPKATKKDIDKPAITIENHSNDDNNENKRLEDSKNFQDSNEALGDFSAVRETEVLKSYRKPPPPQNRARQSKAPRALLKSSAENLDLFSEENNELFRSTDDVSKSGHSTPIASKKRIDVDDDDNKEAEKDDEADSEVKVTTKRQSSQGRSSMLDDINNTLASIHSDSDGTPPSPAAGLSSEIRKSMEDIAKEVKEKKMATNIASNDIRKSMEDIAKAVQQKVNANIASSSVVVNAKVEKAESKNEEDCKDLSESKIEDEVMEKAESAKTESAVSITITKHVENGIEKVEEKITEKAEETKDEIEEKIEKKSVEVENEIASHLHNGNEAIAEEAKAGQVHIEDIAFEVKQKIESKVENIETKLSESFKEEEEEEEEEEKEIVITETFQVEVEKAPEKEVKIPPKVSPKPSPKLKQKNFEENNFSLPTMDLSSSISQNSDEPSSPKTNPVEEIINNITDDVDSVQAHTEEVQVEKEKEKTPERDISPPQTPTTPTSPSTKGQSRIPMSKKSSGIPKFAINSSKSPSSPISSPPADSNSVKKEIEKAADLNTNHHNNNSTTTPSSPTSPQPADSDLNRSSKESSPGFSKDNRGSKTKLTKLRYSGRKKSSESKSDESGSERGSRAGSEAKSDDGKKGAEDVAAEVDKNSRIPVRGGSKPRSSPPKSLGH